MGHSAKEPPKTAKTAGIQHQTGFFASSVGAAPEEIPVGPEEDCEVEELPVVVTMKFANSNDAVAALPPDLDAPTYVTVIVCSWFSIPNELQLRSQSLLAANPSTETKLAGTVSISTL